MEQPQRPRSDSSPLSSLNTTPSPSPQYATNDDVPELLERSTLRLSDVERIEEGIAGEGVLVKLFPVKRKGMRSVRDSPQTLWIVRAQEADSMVVDKLENAQGARASQTADAGAASSRRPKAKVTGGKARRRKGRSLQGKGEGGYMTPEGRGQEDHDRLGGASDEDEEEEDEEYGAEDESEDEIDANEEEREEEEEEEEEEEDEAERDGEEEEEEEEQGTDKHDAEKHVAEELIAARKEKGKQDAEEQDEDEHNIEDGKDYAEETDEEERREHEGEVDEEKGEGEAAGEKAHGHGNARERESLDKDEQEKEKEYDETLGEEKENPINGGEDREAVKPQEIADSQEGARRDRIVGETDDEEGDERNRDSGKGERTAVEEDGSPKEGRKRLFERSEAFGCKTPQDRPNKRSKSDGGESDDGAAMDGVSQRNFGLETTPRPTTSSPASTTASPDTTLAIVRQTSVVPGLGDTERAVWDAAKRDNQNNSLPLEQQIKMVLTALSLGSEEGIRELRRFVSNARRDSKRESESPASEFNLITPHPDLSIRLTSNALVPQSDGLAYFSALYRRLDVLESKETLFAITKRANLAAMARYRESLVPKGVGGNRARDANLELFRAIFPDHVAVQRPEDKAADPAASQDWIRLRNRLQEGKAWLEVRDLFGGDGAFLALPPQCVPDSHVSKISAKNFGPLLGLLDVAWRALDDRARRTMDALVQFALAGQPLPGAPLALERPEVETSAAPAGLSPMLVGWSVSDYATQWSGDSEAAHPREREVEGEVDTPETVRTATTTISREEVVANA